MSRRRKQQLAAAGGALALAIVLVAILAGGGSSGSSHSISVPSAQIPTGSTDPHAQDRRQITALALAYQQALGQANGANPCNYLDPQSRAFATTKARHGYAGGPEPCAFAANQLSALRRRLISVGDRSQHDPIRIAITTAALRSVLRPCEPARVAARPAVGDRRLGRRERKSGRGRQGEQPMVDRPSAMPRLATRVLLSRSRSCCGRWLL